MFLIIIISLVALLVTIELFYKRKIKQFSKRTPGFPLIPFFGNALQFKLTHDGFLGMMMKTAELGKIARVQMGPYVYLVLTDPLDIEVIVTHPKLQDKGTEFQKSSDWLGEGLLTSSGEKWRKRRKLLTPSFHFNILRDFLPIFNRNSRILVESFEKCGPYQPVDVTPIVTLCALDILSESAMGVQLNAQLGHNQEYVKAVKEMSFIIMNRITGFRYRYEFIFKWLPMYKIYIKHLKTIHDLTRSVIKERREALSKDKQDRLNSGEVDEDFGSRHNCFRNELLLYSVATNPEVQEKLYQEQTEIFGDDLDRDITQEDLIKMKYAEMTIKESLRIFPAVPSVLRRLPIDFNLNGTEIPAGVTLRISIISINRNPEVFKDPLKLIPERFSAEEVKKRHAYSSIPFSAGQRNCIGQRYAMMELKCLLSKCVRKLVFSPGDDAPLLGSDLVLKSCNGIKLRIRKR